VSVERFLTLGLKKGGVSYRQEVTGSKEVSGWDYEVQEIITRSYLLCSALLSPCHSPAGYGTQASTSEQGQSCQSRSPLCCLPCISFHQVSQMKVLYLLFSGAGCSCDSRGDARTLQAAEHGLKNNF